MKYTRFIIPAAAILLLTGQAAAQTQEEAERQAAAAAARAEAAQARAESYEVEVARELEEQEQRMAEAARRIAELTQRQLPQIEEMVRRYEIIADGRPRMGVNIDAVKMDGPVEGVKVVAVSPGSAADDAGLRAGDIITAINGDSMAAESWSEANRIVMDFMDGVEEGDILEVEYIRDGKVGTVEVEPRPVEARAYAFSGMPRDFSMPEVHIAPEMAEKLGNTFTFAWPGSVWSDMELVELSEGLGKYFGADSGVLVVSAPSSEALQLEDGDVIVSIDGREPTSVKHALRILGSYTAGEELELTILREKRKRTLEIIIPDDRRGMLWAPAPEPRPAAAPRPAPAPKPLTERT